MNLSFQMTFDTSPYIGHLLFKNWTIEGWTPCNQNSTDGGGNSHVCKYFWQSKLQLDVCSTVYLEWTRTRKLKHFPCIYILCFHNQILTKSKLIKHFKSKLNIEMLLRTPFSNRELKMCNILLHMSKQYSRICSFDILRCSDNSEKVKCGTYDFFDVTRKIRCGHHYKVCFLQLFTCYFLLDYQSFLRLKLYRIFCHLKVNFVILTCSVYLGKIGWFPNFQSILSFC